MEATIVQVVVEGQDVAFSIFQTLKVSCIHGYNMQKCFCFVALPRWREVSFLGFYKPVA